MRAIGPARTGLSPGAPRTSHTDTVIIKKSKALDSETKLVLAGLNKCRRGLKPPDGVAPKAGATTRRTWNAGLRHEVSRQHG